MNKIINLKFIRCIVWILLHWMRTFSLLEIILNFLRSLLKYKASFIVYVRLNNSAFIINMVTVFYLFIF